MQIVAEALVLHGDSRQKLVPFVAESPRRITLGSDPACDWCVRDDDVAARHAEILWDGRDLILFDSWGAGVRVNGRAVQGIWRLSGRSLVELGRVVVVLEIRTLAPAFVETSQPVLAVQPRNAPARRERSWMLAIAVPAAALALLAVVLSWW